MYRVVLDAVVDESIPMLDLLFHPSPMPHHMSSSCLPRTAVVILKCYWLCSVSLISVIPEII